MNVRLDRVATLYVANPLRRCFVRSGFHIPILMYHSVSEDAEQNVHPYYKVVTHPRVFAEQMEFLKRKGFEAISLEDAICKLREGKEAAGKYVVITFDDGFRDVLTHAAPVLDKAAFTATIYLSTGFVGNENRNFKGRECLSWNEVRDLQRSGITFGSHTVTHPKLYGLAVNAIRNEIADSKRTIEDKLGLPVHSFAYPYAFPENDSAFKTRLRNILLESGYSNGVCTAIGRAHAGSDPFFLERLPVNSDDDARLFEAKMAGSYDWIAKPQHFLKKVKNWTGSSIVVLESARESAPITRQ